MTNVVFSLSRCSPLNQTRLKEQVGEIFGMVVVGDDDGAVATKISFGLLGTNGTNGEKKGSYKLISYPKFTFYFY